jgi:hypothetical protein
MSNEGRLNHVEVEYVTNKLQHATKISKALDRTQNLAPHYDSTLFVGEYFGGSP